MSDPRTFVIVGGGLAGGSAAATLRADGFDGRVVLVGSEPEEPYIRPPLSKEYLRGEVDETALRVHEPALYKEQEIELRLGVPVASIEPGAKELVLGDGEHVGYDGALLATGAEPRALTVPGAELQGVHYLRTHPDSDSLRDALKGAARVVVVGAGWIGCEVAASLRQSGVQITLVDPLEAPLARVLGAEVGHQFAELHRAHGVDLRMGTGVAEILGSGDATGVRLDTGDVLDAELVVVGIGATPRIELAEAAGLDLRLGGVRTDARLRTSDPAIYAIGDIAAMYHPLYGTEVRVEHWANAKDQGAYLAESILGDAKGYTRPPFFYSDQYDLGMEYRGWVDPSVPVEVVIRGKPGAGGWFAFWLQDGRVQAGMNVNEWDDGDAIERLVTVRPRLEAARLASLDVPLSEMV
jgi:3-phenylpropionate/trans-cinnamate dioxygenase ferredoxin reductase component